MAQIYVDQKKSRSLRFSLEEKWDTRVLDTNTRQHLTVLIQKLHDLGSPVPSNLGIQNHAYRQQKSSQSLSKSRMGQVKGNYCSCLAPLYRQPSFSNLPGGFLRICLKKTLQNKTSNDFTFMDTTGSLSTPTEFSPEILLKVSHTTQTMLRFLISHHTWTTLRIHLRRGASPIRISYRILKASSVSIPSNSFSVKPSNEILRNLSPSSRPEPPHRKPPPHLRKMQSPPTLVLEDYQEYFASCRGFRLLAKRKVLGLSA